MSRKLEREAAILFTLLALVLHGSFFANAGSLWRDEVNTADFASMPSISAIQESLRYDSFPVLSTLALRGWMGLAGTDDRSLRLYGLVIGVLFVVALWVGSRLLGAGPPWLALALVGMNPWVVRATDSIRPYGLGMIAVALAVAALGRAVLTSSPRWFVAAGALAIVSVQCLYQNAFLVGAFCVAGAVASWEGRATRRLVATFLVGFAAAISLLPYLSSIAGARDWSVLVEAPNGWAESIRRLPEALGGWIPALVWVAVVAWAAFLLVRSVSAKPGARPAPVVYASSFVIFAIVAFLFAVTAAKVTIQPWYLAPLLAALAPALDPMARASLSDRRRPVALGLVAAAAIASAPSAFSALGQRQTNMDEVAAYLQREAQPGDAIVVYPFYLGVSFQRYEQGQAWTTIPPMPEITIHRYDQLKLAMARPDVTAPVLSDVGRALQTGHRVWIVGGLEQPHLDRPPPTIPPAPHPMTGWAMGPYQAVWGEQVAHFLGTHATQFETAPDLGGPRVSVYERVKVLKISGWH